MIIGAMRTTITMYEGNLVLTGTQIPAPGAALLGVIAPEARLLGYAVALSTHP